MYVMFTCDQWKSSSSMKLIGVATNMENVRRSVAELLKNKVIQTTEGTLSFEWNVNSINRAFDYLHIEEAEENAVLTNGSYYI